MSSAVPKPWQAPPGAALSSYRGGYLLANPFGVSAAALVAAVPAAIARLYLEPGNSRYLIFARTEFRGRVLGAKRKRNGHLYRHDHRSRSRNLQRLRHRLMSAC
jgi:hypothetical protein